MGDERAETYLRLLAEAELRRMGEEIRRVDAMAGIEARSREGMPLFGATERAQWKVLRTARILVAAGVLDQECLDSVTSVLSAAIQVRSRLMLDWYPSQGVLHRAIFRPAVLSHRPLARPTRPPDGSSSDLEVTGAGGNWHVAAAGEPWTFGDGTQVFRLRLTPPLTAIPDAAELVLTGPSTRVRVRFPAIGPGLRSARSRVTVEASMRPLIVEVPSPLGLRPTGVERAPEVLRAAGLHALLGCDDAQRVAVPPYDDRRDQATGVLNPDGIAEVARSLAGVVESALQASRLPVVLGGDCSILLGPLLALRRRGRYGLVYLDGHADFQHPDDEPHGEVASLDLALATGRGPRRLTDLDGLAPLVRAEDVALVGYRVFDDNDRFGREHVRDSGITVLDYQDLRAGTIPAILDRALATVTRPQVPGFWVHFDVDVLDDAIMPAVDYRHEGGLSWDEAAQLLQGLLSRPGALGLDVTIFNPNLDPDGSIARQLCELIARSIPAAS